MVNRWDKPRLSEGDRERTTRARQAAEALFSPRRQIAEPAAVSSSTPDDSRGRKPRVLGISSPPAKPRHTVDLPVSPAPQTPHEIPASHFGRIRTWVRYGMTASQAAEVYQVPIDEIERILRQP